MKRPTANLIYEYVSLIEENQLDIKEQKDIYGGIDLDDLPF
jgi:hypothetical protein